MEWIKKIWLVILLVACLLGALGGLAFVGRELLKAQGYTRELVESNRIRDQYIGQLREYNQQLRSDYSGLAETNKRTEANNRQLIENNKQLRNNYDRLIESERERQKNLEEALGILGSAKHE